MEDDPRDRLGRLEEHLGRVTEAAERLISEAGGAGRSERPPPAGWQTPAEEGAHGRRLPELEALLAALTSVRELVPADAAERLMAALKELLLALRALLDYWLDRLDRKPPPPAEVQDIPIG